jgi:hypothetical protein
MSLSIGDRLVLSFCDMNGSPGAETGSAGSLAESPTNDKITL